MSWIKLASHDIRAGLLRKRYLLAPALVVFECLFFGECADLFKASQTLGDMMLFCFRGIWPININDRGQDTRIPLEWLLIMTGVLLINLDYILFDLTRVGQQVMLRSRSRYGWYFSKCLWNICSTALCFCAFVLTAAIVTLVQGGELKLTTTPEICIGIYNAPVPLTVGQVFMAGFVAPALTLAAFSMLQMVLCLFMRPVLSFLICQSLVILSLYWNSPFCLGSGAMAMRSQWLLSGGINTGVAALFALIVILISVSAGAVKFKHMDILGAED